MRPVRMCVVCKKRDFQDVLTRLQCIDSKITLFRGSGRSFYVCSNCINTKKFIKYISKKCSISKEEAKNNLENLKRSLLG